MSGDHEVSVVIETKKAIESIYSHRLIIVIFMIVLLHPYV